MKILELFSGYGTASFALKRLHKKYELVGYSDINKFANKCFKQNHCSYDSEDRLALGDATKINPNELPDFDLLTGGFPCQTFSIAGKNMGEKDTRGTLFHEIIRIAEVKKPKYMLLENVKGLTFKKHEKTFEKILYELNRIGYWVKWKVLNTKDFGIPQNRERIWFICFRDKSQWKKFKLPEKQELKLRVRDILESDVDEKYSLSDATFNLIKNRMDTSYQCKFSPDISNTLRTNYGNGYSNETYIIQKGHGYNKGGIKSDEYSPTLSGSSWENNNYIIRNKRIHEILNSPVNKSNLTYELTGDTPSGISRQSDRIYNKDKWSPTLNCTTTEVLFSTLGELDIRKLTPMECFKLQGFHDNEIILDGLSDSQKYKLAGNGQTVTVVEKLLGEMLDES